MFRKMLWPITKWLTPCGILVFLIWRIGSAVPSTPSTSIPLAVLYAGWAASLFWPRASTHQKQAEGAGSGLLVTAIGWTWLSIIDFQLLREPAIWIPAICQALAFVITLFIRGRDKD